MIQTVQIGALSKLHNQNIINKMCTSAHLLAVLHIYEITGVLFKSKQAEMCFCSDYCPPQRVAIST
jgi:hypothetical protein